MRSLTSSAIVGALLLLHPNTVSSSSESTAGLARPLLGSSPDPFVAASPLIIAAVCSDGVALVATHTVFADEPLMLCEDEEEDNDTSQQTSEESPSSNSTSYPKDLPKSYRGPLRIYPIDNHGTALLSAGWRTDGQRLAEYCRSVAGSEHLAFGPHTSAESYGTVVAAEVSYYMAWSPLVKGKRAFSCVGLLATCGDEQQPGCLWLVDATGAYRCRAQAVGGGADAAIKMNEQLAKEDFDTMTTKDGTRKILKLLMDKNITNLPEETRVEVAAVGFEHSRRSVKRITSKSLFGVKI